MSLSGLLPLISQDPAVAEAVHGTSDGQVVVPPAATAATIAALASLDGRDARPVLAVTATTREADDLAAALASLVEPMSVASFPSWETLPHERLSPRTDTVGRRIAVLRRLAHPDGADPGAGPISVLIAPVRALLQPFARGLGDMEPVRLQVGDDIDVTATVERLAEGGYLRTDLVELVRSGRTPEELSREFEPTAQSIMNWMKQAEHGAGKHVDGPRTAEREELSRLRREPPPASGARYPVKGGSLVRAGEQANPSGFSGS